MLKSDPALKAFEFKEIETDSSFCEFQLVPARDARVALNL